jgi:hypothetical protein
VFSFTIYIEQTSQTSKQVHVFGSLQKAIEKLYVNGQPRWMTKVPDQRYDGKHSIICCHTKDEYEHCSESAIQHILATQHIVVTGLENTEMQFNEEGLATLGGLDIKRTVHGMYSYKLSQQP